MMKRNIETHTSSVKILEPPKLYLKKNTFLDEEILTC